MFRIKLLSAGKVAALAIFLSVAAALAVYLTARGKRAESGSVPPKLQGRVVAVFNNTRYSHEVEGRVRFVLTAGTDRTYEDGTHELEQVRLESHRSEGERRDVVTADRAKLSDPSDLNKLDAEFISNVVVEMSNELVVKTPYLRYEHAKGSVETKEPVEFEGPTLSGRSTGLLVETADERIHLLKDVDVTIKPGPDRKAGAAGGRAAAGDGRPGKSVQDKAARKARRRARRLARGQAAGETARTGKGKGARDSRKPATAELVAKDRPTRIRGASALLENRQHRVSFAGGVIITQGADEMRADRMMGLLSAANRIERIEARGDSYLKQGGDAEIKSADMDFFFGEGNQLLRAVAMGGAQVRSLGPEPAREARAATIEAVFKAGPQGSVVETIRAEGEAAVRINAPADPSNKTNPATRDLSAGKLALQFFPDGRYIKSARADENAVMTVTPVRAERKADKKTIRAPEMNAAFYEEGNLLKTFDARGGVKVEIEAMVAGEHQPRATTSRELSASFLSSSHDVERITQEGDFKYNEGDRNAAAERASYDGQAEILNLRGKRPTAWDAKSRTQADEIDYDRGKDETHARGDVRTTYYSRESAGDATPFKNSRSPVFMTAERADAKNAEGSAVYTGNARGWQDDNFVKGDRIELYEKDKRMVAVGRVESALYDVKREAGTEKREAVPGFASADRMTYSDPERLVHYDGAVKARQGQDRLEAEKVDVYLKKDVNEVDRMMAEGAVVLTQPGRRATGDNLAYTAADGRAVLTGKTARVDDSEKGATMGAQLTFYSRDDKIFVDNQQGTGRVRSTHRLTKSPRE